MFGFPPLPSIVSELTPSANPFSPHPCSNFVSGMMVLYHSFPQARRVPGQRKAIIQRPHTWRLANIERWLSAFHSVLLVRDASFGSRTAFADVFRLLPSDTQNFVAGPREAIRTQRHPGAGAVGCSCQNSDGVWKAGRCSKISLFAEKNVGIAGVTLTLSGPARFGHSRWEDNRYQGIYQGIHHKLIVTCPRRGLRG
jgi:hypothetical protein